MNIYPWQQQQWQTLVQMHVDNALPHALMFSSIPGMAKRELAENFVRFLHCTAGSNKPCGNCESCKQHLSGFHPAHYLLQKEGSAKQIVVDQVRELRHWLTQSTANHGYKTVIVESLDDLNTAACNALLKFLEEPPGQVCFILLDDRRKAILPTIISRVQVCNFANLSARAMESFLKDNCSDAAKRMLCYHWYELGPLELLQLDIAMLLQHRTQLLNILLAVREGKASVVEAAEQLLQHDILIYFKLWGMVLADLLRMQLQAIAVDAVQPDVRIVVQQLATLLTATHVARFAEILNQYMAEWVSPNNLDKNLLLANLLLAWQKV